MTTDRMNMCNTDDECMLYSTIACKDTNDVNDVIDMKVIFVWTCAQAGAIFMFGFLIYNGERLIDSLDCGTAT